jgi:hypothetical protein
MGHVAHTGLLLVPTLATDTLTSWTIATMDEREEENMNADHVYSHHDDGGDQDDVGENDEGLDVEEVM